MDAVSQKTLTISSPARHAAISPETIREQTARILAAPDFVRSRQLSAFLRFVVGKTITGQAQEIKQYTVGVGALGRKQDFDPQTDPIVRITAGRLRRSLERYYRHHGAADPVIIEIPTGSYVPVFHWNHAMKTGQKEIPSPAPVRPVAPAIPTLALLSFETRQDDDEQRFWGDSLGEELSIALHRLHHLQVVGPISRKCAAVETGNLQTVARHYHADFLFCGRILKSGDKVKIVARLMDGETAKLLWSETYTSQRDADLLEFGEDVVYRIAATLLDVCGVIPRIFLRRMSRLPDTSYQVYRAILQYSRYLISGIGQAANDASRMLQEAAQIAPDNATVKALLSDIYFMMYQYGESEELLLQGKTLAREAIRLDPQCQMAHFVIAFIPYFQGQRELFIRQMRKAVRFNPYNPIVLGSAGIHLGVVGEWEEGFTLIERAMQLNPNFPGWYHSLALLDAYRHGRFEEALVWAQKFNLPDFYWDPLLRAAVLGQLGRREKAETAARELLALRPDFPVRGRELMLRTLFDEELVDMLLAGLKKAGLTRPAG